MTPLSSPGYLDEALIWEAAELHLSDLAQLGISYARQGVRRAAYRIAYYLDFCHRPDDASRVRAAAQQAGERVSYGGF